MAIVLTVHLIESVWKRHNQRGFWAPYLVVDHNGQQQQTASMRAATVTAWNQKASFPYVPTSDLIIMAFDAGNNPGSFIGQASVDVAAMLDEGNQNGHAPLISSTGKTLGIVSFSVALSTSSRALAAGLDIPGLTLASEAQHGSSGRSASVDLVSSSRQATLQEDHLSACAFALPGLTRQQPVQQQASMQVGHAAVDKEAADGPSRLGQKLAKGAHGLSSMLGLGHLVWKSCDEASTAAATPAAVAAAPAPACVMPAAVPCGVAGLDRFDSSPEAAGPLPGQLLAKRNSYLRSSNSFSSASAPPYPCLNAVGPAPAAAGAGAAIWDTAAAGPATGTAVGGLATAFAAAPYQRIRYSSRTSRSSDCSSISRLCSEGPSPRRNTVSRRFSSVDQSSSIDRSEQAPAASGESLSPLRSSRINLRLSPSKVTLLAAQRHQQQLERQQLLLLEAEALQQQQAAMRQAGTTARTWDEEMQREYDAAGPAEKEAILYKQLMLQQAEKQAGAAQLLNMLAVQQQQEATHNTQLLAALAALSPGSSPRYLLRSFTTSGEEDGSPRSQLVTACSPRLHQQQPQSPASVHELRDAAAAALMHVPHSPMSACAPELGSPEVSQRPSHVGGMLPPSIRVGPRFSSGSSTCSAAFVAAGVQRRAVSNSIGSSQGVSHASGSSAGYPDIISSCSMDGSSVVNGSSAARDSSAGGSNRSRCYPDVPSPAAIPVASESKPAKLKRKQWAVTDAAAGEPGSRDSGSGSSMHSSLAIWHSCEDGTTTSAVTFSAGTCDADAPCDRRRHHRDEVAIAVEAAVEPLPEGKAAAAACVSPRRKSRFHGDKQVAGGLGQARRSVKSFPLPYIALESEVSAASMASPRRFAPHSPTRSAPAGSHYSEDSEQAAYTCTRSASGDGEGGYDFVRNAHAAGTERWCMHEMLDAVPYQPPPPCFPFHAVSVGPSAPPA